jgi:hypothetical protein
MHTIISCRYVNLRRELAARTATRHLCTCMNVYHIVGIPGIRSACCPFDRDLSAGIRTTVLLTALLALPALQQFRCRGSEVGWMWQFVCCCLTVALLCVIYLWHACMLSLAPLHVVTGRRSTLLCKRMSSGVSGISPSKWSRRIVPLCWCTVAAIGQPPRVARSR